MVSYPWLTDNTLHLIALMEDLKIKLKLTGQVKRVVSQPLLVHVGDIDIDICINPTDSIKNLP